MSLGWGRVRLEGAQGLSRGALGGIVLSVHDAGARPGCICGGQRRGIGAVSARHSDSAFAGESAVCCHALRYSRVCSGSLAGRPRTPASATWPSAAEPDGGAWSSPRTGPALRPAWVFRAAWALAAPPVLAAWRWMPLRSGTEVGKFPPPTTGATKHCGCQIRARSTPGWATVPAPAVVCCKACVWRLATPS